jgi:hypothetical protein
MEQLSESQLYLDLRGFPSGVRDFAFRRPDPDGNLQPVHPMELLASISTERSSPNKRSAEPVKTPLETQNAVVPIRVLK